MILKFLYIESGQKFNTNQSVETFPLFSDVYNHRVPSSSNLCSLFFKLLEDYQKLKKGRFSQKKGRFSQKKDVVLIIKFLIHYSLSNCFGETFRKHSFL